MVWQQFKRVFTRTYVGKQAEHQLQMSVGFSLLCTVFGIPFALTCVKSYYKDNAVLKSVSDSEISSMRKEFLDITGRDDQSSSITKWIEEKHGKELREYLATAAPIHKKKL